MKVLIVNPPYTKKVYSGLKNAVQMEIPLGIAYLGAALEQANISVEILDANAEELSIKKTAYKILKNNADIIAFTSATNTVTAVYEIANYIKKYSNKIIIIGGHHPTSAPEQTLKESKDIDFLILGEGELTLVDLIKNIKSPEKVNGIAHRNKQNKIIITEPRERIKDLDSLPFPARHLFNHKLYRPGAFFNIGIPNKKYATIITARGCPNRCTYCSSVHFWGTLVRFRSPENIISEIEHLIKTYGTKQIAILDDTFTASRSRVEKFCDLILEKNIKIKWWCYARVNTIDHELIKKMKKSGCFALNLGIESGDEQVLKSINKNIDLNQVRNVIQAAKKEDLLVHTSFMIGLPGDTCETIIKTIDFAIELNPHVALFCITTPFPGTELYNQAKEKGWLKNIKNWDDAGLHIHTKYHTDNLSAEEIYNYYKLAHNKFYFRPKYFALMFKRILFHPKEIKGYILAALYMFLEG